MPQQHLHVWLSQCFWCGGSKNEILLDRRFHSEEQKDRFALTDYEPCDTCKATMALGVTLIEVAGKPHAEGQRGMKHRDGGLVYPTGRWWVLKPQAVARIFNIAVESRAFIDREVAEKIGLPNIGTQR